MSERLQHNHENAVEFSSSEQESLREHLNENLERKSEREQSPAEKLEQARAEVGEFLNEQEKQESKAVEGESKSPAARRGPITRHDRDLAFNSTLKQAQSHMPIHKRTFSKIIHTKAVERTSEVLEKTVARPNSLLFGSLFAFIFSLVVYLIAKNIGYRLSGFESIGAFILGWVFGVLVDYVRVLAHGGVYRRK